MAKDHCCPKPSELRVFRLDSFNAPSVSSYLVPSGKVLIINAWFVGAGNSNQSQRLLRNADIVAERQNVGQSQQVLSIVFPTGIAFMAGDTFTIDHNYNQTISCVYGFEQDD